MGSSEQGDRHGDRHGEDPGVAGFELVSQRVAALPVVNHFLHRSGLPALLARYLPGDDGRYRLPPAAAVGLVVTNLLVGRRPLYGLGEWAARFDPALLGLAPGEVARSTMTGWVGRWSGCSTRIGPACSPSCCWGWSPSSASTPASCTTTPPRSACPGVYADATGAPRGGKPTPVITFGHSKDHRPDLKQLVFILTVAADGAVPIAYRLADGNTTDDPTHVPTWDGLVALLGRSDFLYVADSKLCSREAMGHIAAGGGRFITVLPRSRGEDHWFRDWAQTHRPQWTEAERRPGPRHGEPDQVYSTFPAPLPSAEGYRIIWVHSTAKAARDAAARQARIEAGAAAIDALATRLAGPKCRLGTRVAAEDRPPRARPRRRRALGRLHRHRNHRGDLPPKKPRAPRQGHPLPPPHQHPPVHRLGHPPGRLAYDAATDGCFPLITNDTTLTDAEVLAGYRYQPNLERRHHLLKSVQDAAPVLLAARPASKRCLPASSSRCCSAP